MVTRDLSFLPSYQSPLVDRFNCIETMETEPNISKDTLIEIRATNHEGPRSLSNSRTQLSVFQNRKAMPH